MKMRRCRIGHWRRITHPPSRLAQKCGTALLETAGRQIDPETAKVISIHTQILDAYGAYPEIPRKYKCVGRAEFARNPGTDLWIEFGHLPEATRNALWNRLPTLIDSAPIDDDIPW